MNTIAIAGRLLSENKGIDEIINFALEHPDLRGIIVCGGRSERPQSRLGFNSACHEWSRYDW
jgi:hypothetical protein